MAEIKTKATAASVTDFLNAIEDPAIRADAIAVSALLHRATGDKPKMWGPGIVGFGTRPLTYADGRVADWMRIGFAPRKKNITLYMAGGLDRHEALLATLGKHKRTKGCLHINRLADVHLPTLKKLVAATL